MDERCGKRALGCGPASCKWNLPISLAFPGPLCTRTSTIAGLNRKQGLFHVLRLAIRACVVVIGPLSRCVLDQSQEPRLPHMNPSIRPLSIPETGGLHMTDRTAEPSYGFLQGFTPGNHARELPREFAPENTARRLRPTMMPDNGVSYRKPAAVPSRRSGPKGFNNHPVQSHTYRSSNATPCRCNNFRCRVRASFSIFRFIADEPTDPPWIRDSRMALFTPFRGFLVWGIPESRVVPPSA